MKFRHLILTKLLLILGSLFFTPAVSAASLSQLNSNNYSDFLDMGSNHLQALGTGLSFRVTSLDVYLEVRYFNGAGTQPLVSLLECPTSTFIQGTCTAIFEKSFGVIGSSPKVLFTVTDDPYTLNYSKYYFIRIGCQSGCWGGNYNTNSRILVWGSPTDTYPNGSFIYNNAGAVRDIYFEFHGDALPTPTPSPTASPNATISIDSTFGSNGITKTTFNHDSSPYDMAVQTDGKIIVAGNALDNSYWEIARYNTDGSPDTSFGNNGVLPKTLPPAYRVPVTTSKPLLSSRMEKLLSEAARLLSQTLIPDGQWQDIPRKELLMKPLVQEDWSLPTSEQEPVRIFMTL